MRSTTVYKYDNSIERNQEIIYWTIKLGDFELLGWLGLIG